MERGLGNENMKIPKWQPPAPRSELARRFPLYYWPQNLLEDILRVANNRQRKKMLETITTIRSSGKGKREVFRYLEELLRDPQRNPRRTQQFTKETTQNV